VPEPDARRLTLEGAVELRLPSRVESADFVRPGVVERPGVRVELRALEESGTGGMLASVRLTFEDAVRAEAYRPRAADVDFLTDHPGGALGPSIGPVRWREREVEYEVRQSGLRPEDVRGARVRVPSGAALKRVPFVFEGVEAR